MCSADGQPLSKKALKKLEKEREKQEKKAARQAKEAAERAAREANQVDTAKGHYGKLPTNQSTERTGRVRANVKELNASRLGEKVILRARIQTSRPTGGKLCFFVLRQHGSTVQALVAADSEEVSKQMVKFSVGIPAESIVVLEAEVVAPVEPVKSCTVSDVELKIFRLFIESEANDRLPFTLEDASRPEADFEDEDAQYSRVNLDTRLNNRIIDLRTITGQAIFRIQSGIVTLFREYLVKRDFVEIHTPKILGAASEGGANVFEIKYFKTKAFLAQSPQFYKQMCICGDLEKVFEIGPVFRAEDSNTHRHLTEFVGVDMEMAFEEHYHEVLDFFDGIFRYVFNGIKERYRTEIDIVKRQFPCDDFTIPEGETLRLNFSEGVAMLREAGVEMDELDDLR